MMQCWAKLTATIQVLYFEFSSVISFLLKGVSKRNRYLREILVKKIISPTIFIVIVLLLYSVFTQNIHEYVNFRI